MGVIKIKKKLLFILFLACIGVVGVLYCKQNFKMSDYLYQSSAFSSNSFEELLKKRLSQNINSLKIPGIQVSVILQGKEYNASVGSIDLQRKQQIQNDDTLRLGSITKLYTATIVLKLCEEGKLSLDTTIDKWFPELQHAEKITVKELLNHTSGIYSYTDNYALLAKVFLMPKKIWKPEELYLTVIKGKPYFEPGEKHFYSNSNFLLLGLIAEKVSGKKYGELLSEIIIHPLNLKNTSFLFDNKDIEPPITGYDRDMIPFGIHKIKGDNLSWASAAYSAGGITANATDVCRFINGLFSQRIINKDSLNQMTTFQNFTDEDIPEQTGYGLGMRRIAIENDVLMGHTGTIPGFGGAAFYCADKNYYISILGNVSYLKQAELLRTVIKTIEERQ